MSVTVRKATESDVETVHRLLRVLAEHQRRSDEFVITLEELRALMFEEKSLRVVIAENSDGVPIGMAAYYYFRVISFSGGRTLYIEDLYIEEEYRGQGIGTQIFNFIRDIAKEKKCVRMEWKCLDWDSPTIAFYEKMGGRISDGWLTYTLNKENF